MKKYFVILWVILLCCICVGVQADTSTEGLVYTDHGTYIEITDYTGTAIQITVPEKINNIPVTHIAKEAFENTTSLYKITLPEGLLSIGEDAFYGCTDLAAVNLPSTLQSLGEYAFAECSSLHSEITIPESITVVPTGAFNGCKSLIKVNLPQTTTSLGLAAFGRCASLNDISLPVGLQSIGENAFNGCKSLTTLYLPYTLTTIQAGAFADCSNLTGLNWPTNSQLVSIGEWAFKGCTSITTAKIPEGVTAIKQNVFSGCTSLNTVTIPSNLTSIGLNAFSNCTALKSLTIPASVTSISDNAFTGCTALTHTTVPGSYADQWCIRNSSMYSDLFTYEQTNTGKVVTGYTGTGGSVYIPSYVIAIGDNAFKENRKITSLHIPGKVKSVGEWAFYQCDNLTHVRMESGVEKLGKESFSSCDNLISIDIPDTVTELGEHAFYSAYSLESISLPDNIAALPDYCFSQANNLQSIKLPANLVSIGEYAFNACGALEQITIPETVTTIGERAFNDCRKLQQVTIPEKVTSIGSYAFEGCIGLQKITILQNVTDIGEKAFEGCTDELVIYGMRNSRAQSYAAEYEITFVALDADDELAAPQNPSWKEGSTATATWDAVEGADYYELTVYVYDEAGTKLLGTTSTGTSDTEVDVQQEANTIIKQQETEYTTVKLAYTVKAGVADDEGKFTYGMQSAMAEQWEYSFALIQLQPPENIILNENGTASWNAVDGVETYLVRLYGYETGDEPNKNVGVQVLSKGNATGGIVSFDFTEEMIDQYSDEVRLGHIKNGAKLNFCIKVLCISPDENRYITSADSEYSNAISYVNSNLIQLQPPENIILNENGTASWNAVDGVETYLVRLYGYETGDEPNKNVGVQVLSKGNATGGIVSFDFTEEMIDQYSDEVRLGHIKNGAKLNFCIKVLCISPDENRYITSADSEYSNAISYVNSNLIQLQPPENIVLNEDGTASWKVVNGVERYGVRIYGYAHGSNPNKNLTTSVLAMGNESGIESYDLTEKIDDIYADAVRLNEVEQGEKLNFCITVYSVAPTDSQYITSNDSSYSNTISYAPFIPVTSLTLSPSNPILYVGNSYYLGKTITPEDGYYTTIDWSSTNTDAVTVDAAGMITGVAEGTANITASIGEVQDTVPVKVYTISSNIEDEEDKDHITDSAGGIIDDIVNNEKPDLSDTNIPEEDLGDIRDEIYEGIWRGDEFFTDMKWYEENFEKYKNNWGQIQKAAKELNAQFAGAYNIEVEMYHKEKDGTTVHTIGCIEEFEDEITFAFDLPTGMSEIQSGYTRKYVLVRIHRNEMDTIDVEVKNGKVTAQSDGFSDFILLYVDEPMGDAPLISEPAEEQTISVESGSKATMAVSAQGTGELAYQWYISYDGGKTFEPINGATQPSHTTSVVTTENNGYQYYCLVTNLYGEMKSPVFTLSVVNPAVLPETGDNSHLALWLMMMSMAGAALLLLRRRAHN